ncbi:MAG: hypothetical protein MJ054_00135, partial [Clostridia bacterium]|nr:hypothetical protein [Clostridia bacterium]
MSNTIIKSIMPLLSVGMMVIFAIFLVVGILFGLARGAKRSGLHFIIFVGLLFFSFVLTPYIMKSVLGINIFIAGQTPKQFVDDLSNRFMSFLQEQVGDYIVPFQKYIKGYALGVVLAVLNMAVFFALYFVVKIVSWIIYSITAHFVAPKRDRNGNKLPKHAALGGLIGGIQGLCLFVIFMFPFNGIISVVNNAAVYQNMQTQNEQAVNPQSLNEEILSEEKELDLENLLNQVDAPLRVYNSFMKYSGLQFLSNKAFEYQLTIRVDDGEDINLLHDINSGFELYIDSKEFMRVVNKLQKVYDNGKLDLSSVTESDYQVLRQFINRAFDLEILNVVDDLLSDMNSIFNTPFNDDLTKIAGTEIYTNSIYGKMIVHNTAHAENYQEYASGLQAMVNYVADQKLNLVRSDLINMIDFVETFNIYQISYEGLEQSKTLTDILAKNKLG